MTPIFFPSRKEFHQWLAENHKTEKELIVGFYKVSTGKPSMTWSESVDMALCFGWIDGIRKSVDAESYCIRFTPRNPKSIWSNINIAKVEKLIQEGLMTDAGLAAYNKRKNDKSGIYSFENDNRDFGKTYEDIFIKNVDAWEFFVKQSPTYKKAIIHWILSAKQEKTRLNRLQKAISFSEQRKRVI